MKHRQALRRTLQGQKAPLNSFTSPRMTLKTAAPSGVASPKQIMSDDIIPLPQLDDPDVWIIIPDFGVRPSTVDFEGFSLPVFSPMNLGSETPGHLADLIRASRALAQRHFKTLSELRLTYADALDVMEGDNPEPNEMHRTALLYQFVMYDLEQATSSNWTPEKQLEALASASSTLTTWLLDGSAAAAKRRSEINKTNARQPRESARTTDHEEIKTEFKRLLSQGHTRREANGMLFRRGLGSRTKINRITKKVITSAG
jgi:hypothetical protein